MATQTLPMVPDEPVTIGRALPAVRTEVLDSRLRPVARGELYLGGPGVAEGYLGRPGHTAERFVADPFEPGRRLYRTGDLVYAHPDGDCQFLGRADDQLELRGRRIEPAEVEAALTDDPDIAQAVVTLSAGGTLSGDGTPRLVGYVVVENGAALDHTAVRRRLRNVLPAPLVPSMLVELDRLPVSGNGKIDRSALPTTGSVTSAYHAPDTALQHLVADHFGRATGHTRVGLDDDFFELGGNSLLGVSVSADLAAATGAPVTVRWLYTAPTVSALSERIATHETTGACPDEEALGVLLALRRGGAEPPLFCVHSAVPLAWCYSGLARYISDRPVYGVQAPGLTGPSQRQFSTIDELADCYVREITAVQPDGPYHLLGWSLGGQLAHAIAVRLRERGSAVGLLAMLDSVVFGADAPPPPEPQMRDLLTHLLGDEPPDAEESAAEPDISAEDAAADLERAGASFGSGLTAGQLERLHRGYVDGVRLSHGYTPGVFDGDLLYFSATLGMTAALDAELWRAYVTGELRTHPVEATHAQLTNTDVVAVIGPILAAHLTRTGGSGGPAMSAGEVEL